MVNVDPRHHATCPSSRHYHECGEDSYDRAVAWCREAISSVGRDNDMLFSPRAFHREIASASSRFGMPFEVREEEGVDIMGDDNLPENGFRNIIIAKPEIRNEENTL